MQPGSIPGFPLMAHQFKLGRVFKAPAPNALRLRKFWLTDAPPPPPAYDVNAGVTALTGVTIAPQMDANDQYGCCVMAAQAKFLRRYYALETSGVIDVSAEQVVAAYMLQTHGQDNGLIPDESFEYWSTTGWSAGSNGNNHTIFASARVDASNNTDVQLAIWKLGGALCGGLIPGVWLDKTDPWEVGDLSGTIAGGHEMWVYAYDSAADMYTLETWGRAQKITGDAFRAVFNESNQGEACGLVRGCESPTPTDGLDTAALQSELQTIREG